MRIIAGKNRGRKLKSLTGSRDVRPTKDFVREAVFNMLQNFPEGRECLDLFAGFGGMGLEAYSRGAIRVDFVEYSRKNCQVIRENISRLGAGESCEVHCLDVLDFLESESGSYDLVFIDPPYSFESYHEVLKKLRIKNLLHEPAIIVVEHSGDRDFAAPEEYLLLKQRTYGESGITMLEYQG